MDPTSVTTSYTLSDGKKAMTFIDSGDKYLKVCFHRVGEDYNIANAYTYGRAKAKSQWETRVADGWNRTK